MSSREGDSPIGYCRVNKRILSVIVNIDQPGFFVVGNPVNGDGYGISRAAIVGRSSAKTVNKAYIKRLDNPERNAARHGDGFTKAYSAGLKGVSCKAACGVIDGYTEALAIKIKCKGVRNYHFRSLSVVNFP